MCLQFPADVASIDPQVRKTGCFKHNGVDWCFTVPQQVEPSSKRSLLLELTRSLFNELLYTRIGAVLDVPILDTHPCRVGSHPGICMKKFGDKMQNQYDKKEDGAGFNPTPFREAGYNITAYNEVKCSSVFDGTRKQLHRLFILDQLLFNRDRVPHNLLGRFEGGIVVEIRSIDHEEILACGGRTQYEWRTAGSWAEELHPPQMSHMIDPKACLADLTAIAKEMTSKASENCVRQCSDKVTTTLVELIGEAIQPMLQQHAEESLKIYTIRSGRLEELVNKFCSNYAPRIVEQGLTP